MKLYNDASIYICNFWKIRYLMTIVFTSFMSILILLAQNRSGSNENARQIYKLTKCEVFERLH